MNITCSLPYRILLGSLPGVILIVSASRAQPFPDDGVVGSRYVIAFPDTTSNMLDPRFPNTTVQDSFQIFLYPAEPCSIRISNGDLQSSIALEAGKFVTYDVRRDPVVTVSNAKVVSTDPPISGRPMLKPGESVKVVVGFNSSNPNGPYTDSLDFLFGNATWAVLMRANVINAPPAGIDLHSVPVPGYALDGARPNPAGENHHLLSSGRFRSRYREHL
jgi:hypothetical protein